MNLAMGLRGARGWRRSPLGRRLWRVLALAAAGGLLAGCGGGSPSDVVLPGDVDVTLVSLEEPGAHAVGLELGPVSGRELTVRVVGIDLENATGVAFELGFDPMLLEFEESGPGSFFGQGSVRGVNVVEGSPGRLVGVAAAPDQSQPQSGNGPLVTLQFQLKQLRDDSVDLIFAVPASLVYGPAGVAGQHTFSSAQLTTRIRPPQ